MRSTAGIVGLYIGSALSMLGQSASGNFTTTEVTTAASTIANVVVILGAIFVFVGFIFCAVKLAGHDKMGALMGIVGMIFGGVVVGYSKTWASVITGVPIP